MGSVDLEEALRREGAESALSIVETSRSETAAVRAASDASWEQHRRDALARTEAEMNASSGAELMHARRSARRRVLEARHRAIEQVLDAVRTRLLHGPARHRSEGELEDLLRYLPAAEVEIDERPNGFVIVSKDGSITVDATLDRRLDRMRPLLAIRILEMIDREAP